MVKSRQPHAIKLNKALEYPRHWLFVDTETNLDKLDIETMRHTLRLGWACYTRMGDSDRTSEEEWLEFRDAEVFWTFLEHHTWAKSNTMLVAHNVVYDYIVMDGFRSMQARGWELTGLVAERGVCFWTLRQGSRRITVLDSLNIFHESLERIGAAIGVPKFTVDTRTSDEETLSAYCQNDVLILVELFKFYRAFLRKHDLGNFAKTAAGQAMAAYRHRFIPCPIYSHLNERIDDWEHEAYYGGRCEMYYSGQQPEQDYFLLDVNSLYPSIMAETSLPVRYLTTQWRQDVLTVSQRLLTDFAIAHVSLHTTIPAYPKMHANTLIFPVGDFDTVLASPELNHAVDSGAVQTIHRITYYERKNLFREYVVYFYNLRQQYMEAGQHTLAYMVKILLNSLYGKFAQRSGVWENLGECNPDTVEFQDLYRWDGSHAYIRMFAGLVQQKEPCGPAYNSLCAIAAGVTAAARWHLWWLMNLAGRENVYYCDTDSLIVNHDGWQTLMHQVHPTFLGALRLERIENKLTLRGAKDYQFGEQNTIKGVRKNAVQIDANTYQQEHWPSLAGLMRAGTVSAYYTKTVTKTLTREYTKGSVLGDGRVIPLMFLGNKLVKSQ